MKVICEGFSWSVEFIKSMKTSRDNALSFNESVSETNFIPVSCQEMNFLKSSNHEFAIAGLLKMDQFTMNHFKELFNTTPTNTHQLVFYSPGSKYKVISNTNANKLLKKLLDNLNIAPITVHGLRHTHASVLLYQKASIHYISEGLGHSDIETTLKEYTHVLKELRLEDEQLAMKTFENMAG